jgi:hypothetical protein
MAVTRQGYAQRLLKELAVQDPTHTYPMNLYNIEGLVCWMVAEGGTAAWNPLNTTQPMPGSSPLPGNTAGVQEYTSYAQGIDATIKTLLNGNYAVVLESLRRGWKPWALLMRVQRTPWGTHIGDGSVDDVDAFVAGVEDRWAGDETAFKYVSEI